MKKLINKILYYISRGIFKLTPEEFKNKKTSFDLYTTYENEEKLKSYNHFKKYFKNAVIISNQIDTQREIRNYAIKEALLNDDKKETLFYIEFGVFNGKSTNLFADYVNKLYAFDSFEGLKHDWLGHTLPKGTFDLGKKIPNLKKNVEPVQGWVEETLVNFLEKNNPKINFVHMDLDIYESSLYVLKKIKPYLINGAIILFDELYNFTGWEVGEYKALMESFEESEYRFKAFSNDKQVVIKIIK